LKGSRKSRILGQGWQRRNRNNNLPPIGRLVEGEDRNTALPR
jgi:hypothetical protein